MLGGNKQTKQQMGKMSMKDKGGAQQEQGARASNSNVDLLSVKGERRRRIASKSSTLRKTNPIRSS